MEKTNSTNPLVSVVLPFYNAPFLFDAVQSILNQTYQDFELILVDNASNDSSAEVARNFQSDPRVKVILESKRGVVHAANTGIRVAEGDFLARMDADDISDSSRLELQVDYLYKHPDIDAISGKIKYLGKQQENEGFVHYIDWLNSVFSEEEISLSRFIELPVANPSLMIRRSVFERIGGYQDGNFPEDYEFFLRMLDQGLRIDKVAQEILKWRDSPARLTRTDHRYSTSSFYQVKSKYLARWLQKYNSEHPKVWIWGAGRLSRRRSDLLKFHGVEIERYIDFEASENVISYRELPAAGSHFILSYVANRGARIKIKEYLQNHGYVEGQHFILVS